jgi:hypothetical protein
VIFFLDDDPNRTRTFRANVPQADCVETASGMIALLSRHGEASLVFLDHDLGGETFVDSNREDCGMEVVRWVVANRPKVSQFIVHSYNPSGAQRMVDDLAGAGYAVARIPFSSLPWPQISQAAEKIYGTP